MTDPALAERGWLWRPLVGSTLLQVAVSATRPTTSYAAIELGADGFAIGVLAAAYALPSMLAAMLIGRLAGHWIRIGLLPMLAALITGLGCAVSAIAVDLVVLAIGTGLVGLGNIGVLIGAQTWISRATMTKNYDRGFGWMTAGMSGGQALGPLMAGAMLGASATIQAGAGLAFWAAGGICLAVAACFLSPRRAPHPTGGEGQPRESSSQLLRRPGVIRIIFVSAAVLTSVDMLAAYLPLLGEEIGLTPAFVGVLLAARGFSSMASRLLLPALIRALGRTTLVIATTVGSAVTLAAIAVVPLPLLLITAMVIGGFMLGVGQPLTMTAVALAVPRRDRPRALAVRLLGNRVAQIATPLVAGGAAALWGAASVFWVQAAMLMAAAAWVRLAPGPDEAES